MPTRYLLLAGTFLLSMLLYVDRVCISAAKGDVAGSLGFDDRQMGWVFAAFSATPCARRRRDGWPTASARDGS